MPSTLLDILGVKQNPNKLKESALIIVDAQREYLDGKVPLYGMKESIAEIRKLLARARRVGAPVFFIRHSAGTGAAAFDPESPSFQIVDELKPEAGEQIIDKNYPSSFGKTDLHERLKKAGLDKLIITGYMTHGCISATVRTGAELGYACTVVADACGTRDLPAADGTIVQAQQIHNAELAALKDIFATVVPSAESIADG